MGWTVYYDVVRARSLEGSELTSVATLVRQANAKPWDAESFQLDIPAAPRPSRVIARGLTKLSTSNVSPDAERICDALTALQALLADTEVRASDDFEKLGWDPVGRRFAFGAPEKREPGLEDGGDWRSVLELVPPEPAVHAAPLERALAVLTSGGPLGDAERGDEALIGEAFAAMAAPEATTEPLAALIAACDPDTVARIGFARYAAIQHGYAVRGALDRALARITDAAALAHPFLTAWSNPRGTYFYGDMQLPPSFVTAIVAQPIVRNRLSLDVEDVEACRVRADIELRRGEAAALLLGSAGDPTSILRELVRRGRGRSLVDAIRFYAYGPALEGLGRGAVARAVPTMLLALDGATCTTRAELHALIGSAKASPELALPVIAQMLEQRIGLPAALQAARAIGPQAASVEGAVAGLLTYPGKSVRWEARETMAALHGSAPNHAEDPGGPDAEALVLHPDREVRHAALRELAERKDRSLFLSLALADLYDVALRALEDYSFLSFSWFTWNDLIPEKVAKARPSERVAWGRNAAAQVLGPQRILPAIADLRDRTPAEVAAGVRVRLVLDAATRERLLAAERAADTAVGTLLDQP